MIKKLSSEHKPLVLDFAYQRQRENLFVIGSFKKHDDTLYENDFWGYFEGDHLVGLATFFSQWGSFVVNAQNPSVIEALTDEAIRANRTIEYVPCFKQYADVIVRRLKTQHGIVPKELTEEIVMVLPQNDFVDFSTGDELIATPNDIDDIIRFDRIIEDEPIDSPIQEHERKRLNPDEIFMLKKDGVIVSRANPHGISDHYFQIGGVGTLKEHRGKGYAKQVVSALCRHYFDQGVPFALLFTAKNNAAAQSVYAALGFKPDGEFVIAQY